MDAPHYPPRGSGAGWNTRTGVRKDMYVGSSKMVLPVLVFTHTTSFRSISESSSSASSMYASGIKGINSAYLKNRGVRPFVQPQNEGIQLHVNFEADLRYRGTIYA